MKNLSVKNLSVKEIVKIWGKRCPEFTTGCPVCRAWLRHDLIEQMKFEDSEQRMAYAQFLQENKA